MIIPPRTKPKLLEGGIFSDERGQLSFVNDFNASEIKRFYMIAHPNTSVVRAWQAHQFQKRWFYCTQGAFDVRLVALSENTQQGELPYVERVVLSVQKSEILEIPEGYAHGFRALQENSKLLVFSNFGLDEFADDMIRFPSDQWTDWNT